MKKPRFKVGMVVKKKQQGTYHRILRVWTHPDYEPFYVLSHSYIDVHQSKLCGLTKRERMEYRA